MTAAPSYWQRHKLGEVSDFVMGQAPPGSECNKLGVGTPFVKAGEFGAIHPAIREWTTRPLKLARPGDVLICVVGATAGKLNLAADDVSTAIGRSVAAIRPSGLIDQHFLFWLLTPLVEQLRAESRGSAQGVISRRDLGEIAIALPPLAEQRRIVETLEDHFSRLDAAGAYVSCAADRIALARRSWLNQNLGCPPAQELRVVSDVLTESRGGWSRGRRHETDATSGAPYLKMNNISPDGRLDLSMTTFVTGTSDEKTRFALRPGDVLFNSKNSGDLVGKTAIADERVAGWTFNENIMRLRFSDALDPQFVWLWFQAPMMRRAVRQGTAATTNVAAIYMHQLRSAPVWIPDMATQHRLGTEYAAMDHAGRRTARHLSAADDKRRSLYRSLLASAFAGTLGCSSGPADGEA